MHDANTYGHAPHALFFLHGVNVTFEEAASRAAQLGCDLAVPGATAFFSWPSRGNVVAYPADEASMEASERAITDFPVEFATKSGAEKVHVVAHSMGNGRLLRALQRIAANAESQGQVRARADLPRRVGRRSRPLTRPRTPLPGAQQTHDTLRVRRRPTSLSLVQTA